MIVAWFLRWLIPHYDVLVCNPRTGLPSGKSVFATLSFVAGIGMALFAVWADYDAGRPIDKTAVLLLLGNGALLAGYKIYQQQANRRTADEAGQPLAVPPPESEPPAVMPQVENPNVT
jgi:hypothetical protein